MQRPIAIRGYLVTVRSALIHGRDARSFSLSHLEAFGRGDSRWHCPAMPGSKRYSLLHPPKEGE